MLSHDERNWLKIISWERYKKCHHVVDRKVHGLLAKNAFVLVVNLGNADLLSWSHSRTEYSPIPVSFSGTGAITYPVWKFLFWSHLQDQWKIPRTLLRPGTGYGPVPVLLVGLPKINSQLRCQQRDLRYRVPGPSLICWEISGLIKPVVNHLILY